MKTFDQKRKLEKKILSIDREIAVSKARNGEQLRKERAHKLIKLGALFEIAELIDLPKERLLGYLLSFPKNDFSKFDYWDEIGNEKMIERIQVREKKKKQNLDSKKDFTHNDIMELLKNSKEKNIDIVKISQKSFKKNLLENLNYNEFEILKNILESC
ncbi:conjugal transfer protein TraD [Cetobacterium sp.]|uniref:conjugal transfer protein TraD n=1 Tax=Cetobacterium sp. TaxID=2071632 RepID=UPI0025BE7954|nr:conjugal transfer protein TraD [Cetobacterium sp.]